MWFLCRHTNVQPGLTCMQPFDDLTVGHGALRDGVHGRLAGAHHGDALAPDQLGGVLVRHARVLHGVEHPPAERIGASAVGKRGELGDAVPPDAKDQEIEPVRLWNIQTGDC